MLTTFTSFTGDVTGFYNDLQIGATTIGASELVDTAVTAGTYGANIASGTGYYPIFTVDADGRLTSASTVPFAYESPLTFGSGLTRTG